ncbi:NAD nucleotidase [Granulosicoccaceae sp. 1_MG-2023]|nr:NAD nucleotidase [Granulosicoccaceae sp. 1_MG-2023]
MHRSALKTLPLILLAGLSACSDSDDSDTPVAQSNVDFSLRVLHINDHHSHIEPESATLLLGGTETDVSIGGFARVTAKIRELQAQGGNVLKLHAGDAITGTLYYTLFEGEADAALMNDVCFDAFVVGNHEFDRGDEGLKQFLDFLSDGSCNTPVLGANVIPEVGTPLAPVSETDYIKPYTIVEYDGHEVGIIGIEIAQKTSSSSNPLDSTLFLDEATTAQRYIDELEADGITRIVLLTHNQYERDLAMAGVLSGVDVIIDGDSHTLLGEEFNQRGLSAAGPYPTVTRDADGNTVCVAQAWQYSNVVGELSIDFDSDGTVSACEGTPHLLLADEFHRDDENGDSVELSGSELDAVLADIQATDELSVVTPASSSQAIADRFAGDVEVLKTTVIGTATEDLCFERIPGQGRSEIAGCQAQTNARGSDISNIVALAFKEQSLEADVAIQNGGGVRTDIAAGDITIGDAYTLLPFANTLYNLDMTGAEIKQVLEEAIDYAFAEDGSSGAYPYASGLRWDVDMTQPSGSRIRNLQVKLKTDTDYTAIDETATYTVVTNSFTAGGKDGYLTFGDIEEDKRLDTYLDYAQSFVDYVERVGSISKLATEDYSTQSFTNADGVLQQ